MIFRRALQREFTHVAAAVFIALFAILLAVVLIRLLGQAAGGRVPANAVMALIGFDSLGSLPIVLTLAVFVGVLLTLSRCYRESEMVVWFASGLPLTAWIRPVLMFALPLALVTGGVTLFLGPWAHQKSVEYRKRLESRDDTERIAPGVFRESRKGRRVFFVEASSGGKVHNVFFREERPDKLVVVGASEGQIVESNGDRYVELMHGRQYEGKPGTTEYRVSSFERYRVRLESGSVVGGELKAKSRSTLELMRLRDGRSMGELSFRVSMPIASILLVLLAIPLSFVNPRVGRNDSLLLAIFVYLVYYNAILVCQSWVQQGRLSFLTGVIAPHVLAGSVLVFLFYCRMVVKPFWHRRSAEEKAG